MSDSRSHILNRIRSAKKDILGAASDSGLAGARLQDHPANLIPERGNLDKESRIALFVEEAEKVDASIVRINASDQIPQEVAQFLKQNNLPTKIRSAPSLNHLPWGTTLLETTEGVAVGDDEVGITKAFAGVAETGTLINHSGPDAPTTLNFLPPTNIAVIQADQIYGNYEEVWTKLRGQSDGGPRKTRTVQEFMPRTVNFITGPSRTADIEQTLLLGAHGPQRLHIIIVDDELS